MSAGATPVTYAELHCLSYFTFLRGASSPEELVARAAALGYRALALTDECSVAGVVRAYTAAREHGLQLIIGSEIRLDQEDSAGDRQAVRIVVLAADRQGYSNLCQLLTRGRRAAAKGSYCLTWGDLAGGLPGCRVLYLPTTAGGAAERRSLRRLEALFGRRLWLAAGLFRDGLIKEKIDTYKLLGELVSGRIVAAGDVHIHVRGRRALQDTVTAVRLGCTVAEAGLALQASGERHLRPVAEVQALYPADWLEASCRLADELRFTLDELDYQYPCELVPHGLTPARWLRRLTEQGVRWRWPEGEPPAVRQQIEHELGLIAELRYEGYFLTVHDVVRFARDRDILCQGRGSAANSAVCFCLGITEVDPARSNMLFERFISKERNEPPDIDVDFEHERREEVIQYIYGKYGRTRAALTATVISYRPRSAIRDVGKALGMDAGEVDRLAKVMRWGSSRIDTDRIAEAGCEPDDPQVLRLLTLATQLLGAPRHLSQHVGGFLISERPLHELVPVENAAMPDRTVIQWDKNDLDDLGLLKIDVLALGMLSALRRSFDLLRSYYGRELSMATVPAEDPQVYEMVSRGDTVGVFQIESRAQMAMLPRLQPRCFYDLVIEVAIIRPGPIQGDMVHPYLRRRSGKEPVTYPSETVRGVLKRTLGVPIFQEQVMELAMVAAGFSAGEADHLRRSMAAWRRRGDLEPFQQRLIDGMRERGYSEAFAEQLYRQILGFGQYGFPESHAASFALLVYVSAWLKCHEPAVFTCALLNSQPMGFYAPAQLVQMAQQHGVEVRPVDINASEAECSLERGEFGRPALRLGFNRVSGLSQDAALRLVATRGKQPFSSISDLAERAGLHRDEHGALAAADALCSLTGNRHRARWQVAGIEKQLPAFGVPVFAEGEPLLPAPGPMASVISDYASTGVTLREHPLALIRERLDGQCVRAKDLWDLADGAAAYAAGLVITRQRPGSAKNVTFVTLEDETGFINLVVWEQVAERQRQELRNASVLGAYGKVQKQDGVLHLIVRRLRDESHLLAELSASSRDFR